MNKSAFLVLFAIMLSGSFSVIPVAHAVGNQITLEELGVLQLAAHDLFNVDRGDRINANTATDFENGKLDLSTMFIDVTTWTPFDLSDIALGGEHRNRENIILFSVAQDIGQKYVDDINNLVPEHQAKQNALDDYHLRFDTAYLNAFGESVPSPTKGCEYVTMTENLAFRSVHDFLPGNILLDRNGDNSVVPLNVLDEPKVPTLDSALGDGFSPPFDNPAENPLGHTGPLTYELLQLTSDLDGDFDPEFNAITVFIPPSTTIMVDLEEADHNFGVQFETDFTFQHFLDEIAFDGTYHSDYDVMNEIRSLIAKGYGKACYVGGELIPIDSASLILAGAQMTTAWLIPVLVAGAGIVFVLVRRK